MFFVSQAIFEGATVCERVLSLTLALQSYPEYLEFFSSYAVQWVSDFLHASVGQGSVLRLRPTSGHWPFIQVS